VRFSELSREAQRRVMEQIAMEELRKEGSMKRDSQSQPRSPKVSRPSQPPTPKAGVINPQEWRDYQARKLKSQPQESLTPECAKPSSTSSSWKKPTGQRTPNKTEILARARLEEEGYREIEFEPFNLRLGLPGQRCFYSIDYCGISPGGEFTLVEVKGGFERDDARVKRLTAARFVERWGWKFLFMQRKENRWTISHLC
jgi:hypothetical protein